MPAQNVALMANAEINSSTLKVDPNGGIWNGSNNVQSFKNNYRYQKMILLCQREVDGNLLNGLNLIHLMVQ